MSVEAGWIPVSSCSRIRGFRQRWKLVSGDRQKTRCASLNRCNACKKMCQLQSNCDSKKLAAHWQPLLSWPWTFWLGELNQCLVCILMVFNILEVTFWFFGLVRAFLVLCSKDEAAATYFVYHSMRADIRGNSRLDFIQQNPHTTTSNNSLFIKGLIWMIQLTRQKKIAMYKTSSVMTPTIESNTTRPACVLLSCSSFTVRADRAVMLTHVSLFFLPAFGNCSFPPAHDTVSLSNK